LSFAGRQVSVCGQREPAQGPQSEDRLQASTCRTQESAVLQAGKELKDLINRSAGDGSEPPLDQ
jgi:hypothetical protein